MATIDDGVQRTFSTGATRDTSISKLDYDGFLSWRVLQRYAEYMHRHRKQSDGSMRDSDNWQKGIPEEVYRKSMWRHFMDVWKLHRLYEGSYDLVVRERVIESLCALLFNVMGLLHELLAAQYRSGARYVRTELDEAADQITAIIEAGRGIERSPFRDDGVIEDVGDSFDEKVEEDTDHIYAWDESLEEEEERA